MGEVRRKSRLKSTWSKILNRKFLLCVNNEGYEASLELRKLYEKKPDKGAEKHGQVRIIDESGEDYLFPASYFAPIRLLAETKMKILEKV
jgi:hypothetical protein